LKLTLETSDSNIISAWKDDAIRVGEEWHHGNVVVGTKHIVAGWTTSAAKDLTANDLRPALDLTPEIVLLGTGRYLIRPGIDLMAELAERGLGLEIMDTAAACRTYNVLIHEQREVVAALLFD